MTAPSRADAIAALIAAELERQRCRLNADGDLHRVNIIVRLSDRNGMPYAVNCTMETERRL